MPAIESTLDQGGYSPRSFPISYTFHPALSQPDFPHSAASGSFSYSLPYYSNSNMPYSAPLTHSLHIPRTHVALYPHAHIYDSSLIHRHNDIEGQGAKQKASPFAPPSPWIAGQEPSMESRIDRPIGRGWNGHSDSPSMNIPIPQESSYNVRPRHLCKVTKIGRAHV